MDLKFEWDAKKAASNRTKHGVTFQEAVTVFADPLAQIFDDEDHSIDEKREIIIRYSFENRLLVVCFTAWDEWVRIFSARTVTANERKDYEENLRQ